MHDDLTAELLKIRRSALGHLEQQRATLGIVTPPYIRAHVTPVVDAGTCCTPTRRPTTDTDGVSPHSACKGNPLWFRG